MNSRTLFLSLALIIGAPSFADRPTFAVKISPPTEGCNVYYGSFANAERAKKNKTWPSDPSDVKTRDAKEWKNLGWGQNDKSAMERELRYGLYMFVILCKDKVTFQHVLVKSDAPVNLLSQTMDLSAEIEAGQSSLRGGPPSH